MVSCAAFGCTNRSTAKLERITFHRFPANPLKRDIWVKAVRRENWAPTKSTCLCSAHFEEKYIDRTSVKTVRLRDNARPTIFACFPKYLQKMVQESEEAFEVKPFLGDELYHVTRSVTPSPKTDVPVSSPELSPSKSDLRDDSHQHVIADMVITNVTTSITPTPEIVVATLRSPLKSLAGLPSPVKRRIHFLERTFRIQQRKLKTLQQANSRYKKKIDTLKNLLKEQKNSNIIDTPDCL